MMRCKWAGENGFRDSEEIDPRAGGCIGCPYLDIDQLTRDRRACDLHRHAEFAGLVLSDLDDQPAIDRALDA